MANHFGFLDSQEEELNRIGLEIYDVSPGRYLEIDLNIDRKEPQRVYPYGRFDTITVLNPQEIIDHEIWIYINRPYLENRYPLNQISRMETKGNEIYLQHEKINAKLKLLIGGDARAFKVDPINKDNSVTDLGLLNDKARNIQDHTEILKENSETVTANIGQINVKQNAILAKLEQLETEIQAVKANQLSGDQKVQLFENTLSRETVVLPRQVRQVSTATIQVHPPDGLHPKGVSLILRVFGVTGTFGTNQGIRLSSGQTGGGYAGYGAFYVASDRLTAPGFITTIWHPGIQSDGVSLLSNNKLNIVNLPFSLGYITLQITGDFDTGQGFDCEVRAIWWV